MSYDVIARRRDGHIGFRRGGRFFSSEKLTRISDKAMTPEILAEPALIVMRVESAVKKNATTVE